jgi:hypothetical protein
MEFFDFWAGYLCSFGYIGLELLRSNTAKYDVQIKKKNITDSCCLLVLYELQD